MFRKLFILSALLLLAGCTNQPLVTINALSSGEVVGKKIAILPADKELLNTHQIEYKQIATVIAAGLYSQGYTLSSDEKEVDQVIFLSFYRSGAVTNTRNVTIPIIGETGIKSSTTYSNFNTNVNSYGNGFGSANTIGTSTTNYTPSYGITGTYNTTVTDTRYGISVALLSYDLRSYMKNKQAKLLWKTTGILISETPDGIADYKGLARILTSYADKTTDGDIQFKANIREKK